MSCFFRILAAFACSGMTSLIICFFLVGFGNACSQVVIYEISTDALASEQKAFNDVLANSCSTVGELLVLVMGFFCLSTYGWRIIIALACIPTFILCIFGFIYLRTENLLWIMNEESLMESSNAFKSNRLLRSEEERGNIKDLCAPNVWTSITWPLVCTWTLTYFVRCSGLIIIFRFYSMDSNHCNHRFGEMFFTSITQILGIVLAYHMLFNMKVARSFIQIALYILAGIFAIVPIPLLNRGTVNVGALLFVCGLRSCLAGVYTCLGLKTLAVYPTDLRVMGHKFCAVVGTIGKILAILWMFVYAEDHATTSLLTLGIGCFSAAYFASKLPFETSSGYLNSRNNNGEEEMALFTGSDHSGGDSRSSKDYQLATDVGRDLDLEVKESVRREQIQVQKEGNEDEKEEGRNRELIDNR